MDGKEILDNLYSMSKEMTPTEEYNIARENYKKEKAEFLQIIGKQHEKNLENLTDTMYAMEDELSKQVFSEGFSMAINLMLTVIIKQ